MPSISGDFADAIISRGVNLQQFAEGRRLAVLGALEELQAELIRTIESFDIERIKKAPERYARLQALLVQTKETIATAYKDVGKQNARELQDVAKLEGTFASKNLEGLIKIDARTVAWTPKQLETLVDGTLVDGAPSKAWWDKQGNDLRHNFEREVRLGVLSGETNDQIVRRVRGGATGRYRTVTNAKGVKRKVPEFVGGVFDKSTREATALVRTSVQAVAQASRTRTYEENQDVLRGWQLLTTLDGRVCPECGALSGGAWDFEGKPLPESRVKEDAPEKPPYHMNCLPGSTLVRASGVRATSERCYEGVLVVIRTAAGNELACTANHPILTREGWLPACQLDETHEVVSRALREGSVRVAPDDDDMPTSIEEVARAFARQSEMFAVRVPVSPEDFHGDGAGSQVAVVRTHGFLGDRVVDASESEHLTEPDFQRRDAETPELIGLCTHEQLGAGSLPSDHVREEASASAALLTSRHARPLDALGVALTADAYSVLDENDPDGSARHAEMVRQRLFRLPGFVAFDQIVYVGRVPFSGHVFNLETRDGYYFAGGIVTHNCRCQVLPITKSWADLTDDPAMKAKLAKAKVPEQTQASMDGQVAADLNYEDWLKEKEEKEPGFAASVLGVGKSELWKSGEITAVDLVDQTGRIKTLKELQDVTPPAEPKPVLVGDPPKWTHPEQLPKAGETVDGRTVINRTNVPNTASIDAELALSSILKGLRTIKIEDFEDSGPPSFYSVTEKARTEELARKIEASKEIAPLIVVYDAKGPYILEGGHRFDALKLLKAKSFPALVVIDDDFPPEDRD